MKEIIYVNCVGKNNDSEIEVVYPEEIRDNVNNSQQNRNNFRLRTNSFVFKGKEHFLGN